MFALAAAHLPLSGAPVERALFALGTATMGYTVLEMFVKAVVAGWIIATMVWLMPRPSRPGCGSSSALPG